MIFETTANPQLVHLATFLALMVPNISISAPLSPTAFLVVCILSAVLSCALCGRYRIATIVFASISGGLVLLVFLPYTVLRCHQRFDVFGTIGHASSAVDGSQGFTGNLDYPHRYPNDIRMHCFSAHPHDAEQCFSGSLAIPGPSSPSLLHRICRVIWSRAFHCLASETPSGIVGERMGPPLGKQRRRLGNLSRKRINGCLDLFHLPRNR